MATIAANGTLPQYTDNHATTLNDATPVVNGSAFRQDNHITLPPPSKSTEPRTTTTTTTTTSTSYPQSRISLVDGPIDDPRPLDVAVIGGGLAGVLAGILLPAKVPNIRLTIYDKNKDFGGTWLENVYPGVRCDIPSHVYQSTFSPKSDWSDHFAQGDEIRDYWQATARKYGIYRYARFGRAVEDASWEQSEGRWRLTLRNMDTEEVEIVKADAVLSAVGRFNAWRLPDYPGMAEYKGLLRHASDYDPTFDASGKKVAVIGNGASGIQLVANLQKKVSRLDHYARNKTWISASWAGDERTLESQPIPEEMKKSFEDHETYLKFRKELEAKYWRRFRSFIKGSEANEKMREQFMEYMKKRLAKKPELVDDLIPDFSPNCRRLTPGPGYLEALMEEHVEYIKTPIKRFTETGTETTDGILREVDAVFCGTGANIDMVHRFPVRANGRDLRDLWRQDGEHGFPYTYFGLATPGFPNYFHVHGPHGTGPSGTVPHAVEVQLTYFAKLLHKMSREGIRSMVPQTKAADEFVEYADAFFATTVLADNCSSWYIGGKPGGRIHGLWPGSAAHVTLVRREPRWEDWEYDYLSETGNRYAWYFGNGWTRSDSDAESDMTTYLKKPSDIDLRDLHESWWDLPGRTLG